MPITYEEERQVEVCERGPREQKLDRIVDELDLDDNTSVRGDECNCR